MKNHLNPVLFFLFLCVSTLSAQPGKLISHAFYTFDTGTGALLSGDSITVGYNGQLLPDMYRNYKLSATGTWHVTSRSVFYEYDAGENLLGFTQQVGNDQDGWTNTWRYSNSYNANNQELSSKLEKWDGNGWILNSLNEKEYDAAGNLISSSGQSVRTLYTYNAEGLLESEITQYNIGNDWLNSAKEAYSYVAGTSHVDVQTTFYWAAGAWGGSARQTFQYDANGHNTQLLLEY
ncbi:MAG: hypothetical protein IT261_05930, partial [Saprospiraceae bacterium]|nr:hypothetical protein [Saprospiraceae bacterium]